MPKRFRFIMQYAVLTQFSIHSMQSTIEPEIFGLCSICNVVNGVLTAPWVMTVLNIKTLPKLYLSRLGKPYHDIPPFKCMRYFNFGRITKLYLKQQAVR